MVRNFLSVCTEYQRQNWYWYKWYKTLHFVQVPWLPHYTPIAGTVVRCTRNIYIFRVPLYQLGCGAGGKTKTNTNPGAPCTSNQPGNGANTWLNNISMKVQTQTVSYSIFEAIAALRWPGFTISGAGALAVALECARKVILCQTPLEAQVIAAERCSAMCNQPDHFYRWHRIHELNAPKPRQTVLRNLPRD